MKKVVINTCYGGFSLSKKAYEFLGLEWDNYGYEYENDRTNEKLIECVEKLKEEVNGNCAKLKIVEIPEDIEFEIEDYDGIEWISEKHRTWGSD